MLEYLNRPALSFFWVELFLQTGDLSSECKIPFIQFMRRMQWLHFELFTHLKVIECLLYALR